MNATKYSLRVDAEALDVIVFRSQLLEVLEHLDNDFLSGELSANDGDYVRWDTTQESVEF